MTKSVLLETARETKESSLIHEVDAQHQDEVEIADSSDYVLVALIIISG